MMASNTQIQSHFQGTQFLLLQHQRQKPIITDGIEFFVHVIKNVSWSTYDEDASGTGKRPFWGNFFFARFSEISHLETLNSIVLTPILETIHSVIP